MKIRLKLAWNALDERIARYAAENELKRVLAEGLRLIEHGGASASPSSSTGWENTLAKQVYVSIGNSDDKLRQKEWSAFSVEVEALLSCFAVHGAWFSRPDARWQNACWCIDIDTVAANDHRFMAAFKDQLRVLALRYKQDSIAWAEVGATEFLSPLGVTTGVAPAADA